MQGGATLVQLAGAHLQIVEGVGFEDAEEGLLALRKAELRVLGEGAVDVARDNLVHLLLPDADLQQRVVPRLLPILCADGPCHIHHRRHDPCTMPGCLSAGQHSCSALEVSRKNYERDIRTVSAGSSLRTIAGAQANSGAAYSELE